MNDLVNFIKKSPIWFVLIALGFFFKFYIEKQIETVHVTLNDISKSSLTVKTDLRTEERSALIKFRKELERWEHHLFSGLVKISNAELTENSVEDFYQIANDLSLNVKLSAAELGILAQNEDIYLAAYNAIIEIGNVYNPLTRKYVPLLIDVQTNLEPVLYRSTQINKSMAEGTPLTVNLQQAQADLELSKKLNAEKTQLIQQFYDEYLTVAQKILNKLAYLKEVMNTQVYRPIKTDQIGE